MSRRFCERQKVRRSHDLHNNSLHCIYCDLCPSEARGVLTVLLESQTIVYLRLLSASLLLLLCGAVGIIIVIILIHVCLRRVFKDQYSLMIYSIKLLFQKRIRTSAEVHLNLKDILSFYKFVCTTKIKQSVGIRCITIRFAALFFFFSFYNITV